MRATPMAVFMSRSTEEYRFNAVTTEASMTHSNKVVQQAIFLYCHSIGHLLRNPNEPNRAKEAYDIALEASIKRNFDPCLNDWFKLSKDMNAAQDEKQKIVI